MANLKSTVIYGDLSVNGNITNKASTTTDGVVQLNDSVASTSITQAATANAVKKTYDLASGKLASNANAVSASKWVNSRTITLSGSITGSTSIDGSANVTINASYSRIDLTGQTIDLNNYTLSTGSPLQALYIEKSTGGAANITNAPVKEPFLLDVNVIRYASASDYITKQVFTSATTKSVYERYCTNGTWSSWINQSRFTSSITSGQVLTADGTTGGIKTSGYTIATSVPYNAKFTDTVTTVNNTLTSTSSSEALSAAQGKTLKDLVDGKAASSHTHNYAGSSSVGGSANTAVKLATPRSISLTGGVTGSVNFDGSANVSIATTASWDNLTNKPSVPKVVIGNSTFNADTPVVITIGSTMPNTNYHVSITPTANPEGGLGEFWITEKTTTTFKVNISGSTKTAFSWMVTSV